MKKTIFLSFFTLANATFLSLGMECLLNLLSLSVAVSLESTPQYPRFIPFCLVLGIVAMLGLISMLLINSKVSEKLGFTKASWILEYIFAIVLSVPMIKLWEMLFDFLQKNV